MLNRFTDSSQLAQIHGYLYLYQNIDSVSSKM